MAETKKVTAMRKIILSLLLASVAATPAMAQQRDRRHADEEQQQPSREERQQVRQERQQAREERQQQARPDRATMVRPQNVQQNNPMVERGQRNVQVEQQRTLRERMQERRQAAGNETLRGQDRPVPNVLRDRTRVPVVSTTPRRGTQPPLRVEGRRHGPVNWSTNWRNDHRYDWRRWRDNNRSRFHLSFYYDPFGWGYQPYSIGWRLWPSYYSSRYWINDPWQYRLPYAPAGTRWVRYYDDAVLVDTWTGEVVDVIYNFFW